MRKKDPAINIKIENPDSRNIKSIVSIIFKNFWKIVLILFTIAICICAVLITIHATHETVKVNNVSVDGNNK